MLDLSRIFRIAWYLGSLVISRMGRLSNLRSALSARLRNRRASSPYSVGIALIAVAIFLYCYFPCKNTPFYWIIQMFKDSFICNVKNICHLLAS